MSSFDLLKSAPPLFHSNFLIHPIRVLVPFGLIPERAAEGCWAEALRLVLAPASAVESDPGAHDVDGDGTDAKRAAGNLTLPGGLWDPVSALLPTGDVGRVTARCVRLLRRVCSSRGNG